MAFLLPRAQCEQETNCSIHTQGATRKGQPFLEATSNSHAKGGTQPPRQPWVVTSVPIQTKQHNISQIWRRFNSLPLNSIARGTHHLETQPASITRLILTDNRRPPNDHTPPSIQYLIPLVDYAALHTPLEPHPTLPLNDRLSKIQNHAPKNAALTWGRSLCTYPYNSSPSRELPQALNRACAFCFFL